MVAGKSAKEQGVTSHERPLVVFGILLIAIGIAGLLIDNISFTEKRVVVDAGPIKVTADQQRTIPIPSIAGVIAVIAGAGWCSSAGRRGARALPLQGSSSDPKRADSSLRIISRSENEATIAREAVAFCARAVRPLSGLGVPWRVGRRRNCQ